MSTAPLPGRDEQSALAHIEATLARIGPRDPAAEAAARERLDRLAKPPGSLGGLEALATRIAGITGQPRPRLERRLVVVAAADHGVARRGVSAYPPEVTAQMVANFVAGGAAINVLARHAGARVTIVDAGVASPAPLPGAVPLRLGPGTDDITAGPAMSRALAAHAVASGIDVFERERADGGVDVVALGEMGIGNTTAAAALTAAFAGAPAAAVTGRGTGVDDATYARKIEAVAQALTVNDPAPGDGLGGLAALGGFEIGVLAGVALGAAAERVPVLVDGFISAAGALVAQACEPVAVESMIAAHRSAEPGHAFALRQLGLRPLLDLDMRLGEGSGAALALSLCVAACRVLDEMATFEEAGVSGANGKPAARE